MNLNRLKLIYPSIILLFAVLALVLLGLVVLASASHSFANGSSNWFLKQFFRLVLAVGIGFSLVWIDLEKARSYVWVGVVISILLLIAVLIPGVGVSVNGSKRWLDFGLMRLQASDVAKVGLIFFLADYLGKHQRMIKTFKVGFLYPALMIMFFCGLVILEPDFGTTFLCGLVGFSMLFLAGVRLKFLIPFIFSGLSVFFTAILLNPVRLKRLTAFMDLEANKLQGAYQLWQSILSYASGGLNGVGLGQGRQQLAYLPEAHTDFIFPIIGEELGLFFTLGVVCLFFIIFTMGCLILRKAPNIFYFSLFLGAMLCMTYQSIINIAVVTGLMPTKGIPLPFISYGGSNLLLMFILLGIIINCVRVWSCNPLKKAREI